MIPELIQELPSPDAVYETKHATFEVYRAKNMYSKFWRSPVLKNLVECMRESYARYGARAVSDPYDEKAAIYLVRASYLHPQKRIKIEEWISSRLVPGNGKPIGCGELEIYSYDGKSMDVLVREKLGYSDESFWDVVLSSSRMCGVPPYISGGDSAHDMNLDLKHRYTTISNALIRIQFLCDYNFLSHLPYHIVTAIIRDDLHQSLVVETIDGAVMPVYTPAHEYLGFNDGHAIVLDRSVYAYEFPSYWLDIRQLMNLLKKLLKEKTLSRVGLQHYLHGNFPDDFDKSTLGSLLTADGLIVGGNITGEMLRKLVDERVDEKTILRITDAGEWFEGYNRILEAVGINIISSSTMFKDDSQDNPRIETTGQKE